MATPCARGPSRPALALLALAGCLPPEIPYRGGETLYVREDALASDHPGNLSKIDPRTRPPGSPLHAIARGARVRVAADFVAAREAWTPDAPLRDRNPWVLVEVVESPQPAQRALRGWVHADTLATARVGPAPPLPAQIARDSILCPSPDAARVQCEATLPAGALAGVIACGERDVEIEAWLPDGRYARGFVRATQLANPCSPSAPGE